ncbi:MAG: energy transducer TonB [Acidobacteriota bacterium]|nr:energy transducer TonB [Acidobacteriota bacterium]
MDFLFEQQEKRMGPAVGAALFTHIALVLVFVLLISWFPATDAAPPAQPQPIAQLVWIPEKGPGGGGGGGGNRSAEPPRKAELPGKDKLALAVAKPPDTTKPKPKEAPKPPQEVNIPAMTVASGVQKLPGVIENLPPASDFSQGSGTGGGAGSGSGVGVGSGQGSGLGPGYGGGTGGGAYQMGTKGLIPPSVITEVRPQYTSDAMRAKIQGTVWLECIVEPDGTVGNVRVIKSLDPTFGLDQEAIKAARQWRFVPGTMLGKPVPVRVTIELTFTLR